jgi:hypothetical protein
MGTLTLTKNTPLEQATVVQLVWEAVSLNLRMGDPTTLPKRTAHDPSLNAIQNHE